MNTVLLEIDTTSSYGKNIMKDLLEHKEYVKIHYISENHSWHKFEDVVSEGLSQMSEFYGVDMHELSKYGKSI
jgi:hypothetical protein